MSSTMSVAAAEEPGADADDATLERLLQALRATRDAISGVLLGQDKVVEQLLVALIAGGHVLLEGPPGVGKTLLVKTLGQATGLGFARIQFTPDLMPADITGSMVLIPGEDGRSRLEFQKGPVFTQLLLADEINRSTPRTQSALLEAMQERTISAAGRSMTLPQPFFVLATQNPIEMEGTYSLPEAQIDRFLFRIDIAYPSEETLARILSATTGSAQPEVVQALRPDDIVELQNIVRSVPVAEHVRRSVARLGLATQPGSDIASASVRRFLRFGLSPRGAQAIIMSAKANALFAGRYNVAFDDLRAVLLAATRHRIHLNYEGVAEGVSLEALILETFEQCVRKVS